MFFFKYKITNCPNIAWYLYSTLCICTIWYVVQIRESLQSYNVGGVTGSARPPYQRPDVVERLML